MGKMNSYFNKSDMDLIKKSKAGNKQAITYLIKRYEHIVKFKAQRYSHHANDFDDFKQEGLIALYEAINNFKKDKEASFRTFIEICIDRKLTSYIRKQTTEKVNLLSNATPLYELSPLINTLINPANKLPENILLKKAKSIILQRCITQKLTVQEAEVIQAYLQDKTLTDISKELNLPYKAVDNSMQRAIKKLRKCIES